MEKIINIENYLKEHENKDMLRFLTCGNVDDGKSTLIGKILYDTKMIFEDQISEAQNESQRYGTTGEKLDLALSVDSAKKGNGAFKNGKKLPLKINLNPKEKLEVVASKSHLSKETQRFIDSFMISYYLNEYQMGLYSAYLINVLCGLVGYMLNMTNNQYIFMKIILVGLILVV